MVGGDGAHLPAGSPPRSVPGLEEMLTIVSRELMPEVAIPETAGRRLQ